MFGMVAFFNISMMILAGSFIYTARYKIHDVASYTSPDEKYELLFQQIGDADWPFGHTHARLVLKDEVGTIAKYSFDIANDGANASSDLCQVTWKAAQVEAVISGEEQNDTQYVLFFNGKTDSNQLDTNNGCAWSSRKKTDRLFEEFGPHCFTEPREGNLIEIGS